MNRKTESIAVRRLLYCYKDAAACLSLSVRSIGYLVARGDLKVRSVGKKKLIPAVELERFAEQDHAAPTTDRRHEASRIRTREN